MFEYSSEYFVSLYVSYVLIPFSLPPLGKSSLKKTIFGEAYDPLENPTFGIQADPSITRIQFKQFRDWVQQPASKIHGRRLNLEYTDIIIDFILNFLQQPRISDDVVDPLALQIEKDQVKNVNFDSVQYVIPESEIIKFYDDEEEDLGEEIGEELGEGLGEELGEEEEGDQEAEALIHDSTHSENGDSNEDVRTQPQSVEEENGTLDVGRERMKTSHAAATDLAVTASTSSETSESSTESSDRSTEEGYQVDYNPTDDDRLRRFAEESKSMQPLEDSSISTPVSDASTSTTNSAKARSKTPDNQRSQQNSSLTSSAGAARATKSKAAPSQRSKTSSFIVSRSRGELSRLLVEKIPMEILKRMVFRWPVGDEQVISRSELNRNRIMLTVWDVSGDPVQQNFTPFFFSDRCMYVATYNLVHNLDAPCEAYVTRNLPNFDGTVPTNAESLEGWIGCATAFSRDLPSEPFRCTKQTPVLPPIILACTHADEKAVRDNPIVFHNFFSRESFDAYKRHLVESNAATALRISNKYESDDEEGYSGHHILRREIDYLARQMPYAHDNVPVQWVKFEQLIHGLQEQKKIILLVNNLARYISEHCKLSGPLQILPALAHFHDIGVIVHFYRHPELSNLVVTKPQWLISALGTMVTSNPGKWVTAEVQLAFDRLSHEGAIAKDMLLLAYRCARMPQRYWNEMLFILNCMDLVCCHPSVHERKALLLPCMITQRAPECFLRENEDDPAIIQFTARCAAVPIAIFNQLVVRCIRSCQFRPMIRYQLAHFQLNRSHHLILRKKHAAIVCVVQTNTFCPSCDEDARYPYSPECSCIDHIVGVDVEYMPSENIATLIDLSRGSGSGTGSELDLLFSDEMDSFKAVCPKVRSFMTQNLLFLCHCWFPGLKLEPSTKIGDKTVVLDQYWRHSVLKSGGAPAGVQVWFE